VENDLLFNNLCPFIKERVFSEAPRKWNKIKEMENKW
jgi:hypothetical protein